MNLAKAMKIVGAVLLWVVSLFSRFLMDIACIDGSKWLGSFVGRVVVRVKGEQSQPGAVSPGHRPAATGDSQ